MGMRRILILGPSETWDPTAEGSQAPLRVRQRIRDALRPKHDAYLLEDDETNEPLTMKYERHLGDPRLTDVLIYWPPKGKAVTLQQEIALLVAAARADVEVWLLHDPAVMRLEQGRFEITQQGDRGSYTRDLALLGPTSVPYTSPEELDEQVNRMREIL